MRLVEYVRKREGDPDFWKDGGDEMFDNCKPFIKELKKAGMLLKRGTKKLLREPITFKDRRDDRQPLSSSEGFHNYCDVYLHKKFGWYPRSSGVFAKTGTMQSAYGTAYYVFIPGKLDYIWSPDIYDLFVMDAAYRLKDKIIDLVWLNTLRASFPVSTEKKILPDSLIGKKSIEAINHVLDTYKDKNLVAAIKSHNEIMFNCDHYYMVNARYESLLMNKIFEVEVI